MKKILVSSLFCIFIITSLQTNSASKNKETYEYLDLFGQIFDRVRSEYVEEVTDEELIEKAIDGMLTGLDPHSSYMNEKVWQEMQMDTSGKFGGLGIEITMEEGFVKVVSPIEDTPAFKAGVIAGDYIIQIDETPVFGLTLSEAVELMRGDKGQPITITISREGTEPFEVEIIRDIIKIQSVKYEIINNIGYLRITSFTEQTESGLLKSIKKIKEELNGKQIGFILDVRSNPGGLLNQSIKVSDIFLERGEIVSTRGRDKENIRRYRAKKGDEINGQPLIVLINGGSASASEIVAGALQNHKRAILLGVTTFGKGSVQTVMPLGDGRAVKLTTARYFTPNGRSIQAEGIVPDIIIERAEIRPYKTPDRVKEADLDGHLEAEEKVNEGDDSLADNAENQPPAIDDNQLYEALNLLKGFHLLGHSALID